MARVTEADVVVVGAGLAGLAAARDLVAAKREVVVVEARDRVGGRVHGGKTSSGLAVDLGAQWVGPNMRRVRALAESLGVETTATHVTGTGVYIFGGRRRLAKSKLPPLPVHALIDLLQFRARFDRLTGRVPSSEPWLAKTARELDAQTLGRWVEHATFTRLGRAYWSAIGEEGLCVSMNEVSLLEILWQMQTMGGRLEVLDSTEQDFFTGGAHQLAEGLAERLGHRVQLGRAVRRIEHSDDWVRVITDDGEVRAKRCIVAMPPVLAGRIDYSPALPALRDQLTQRVGQGSIIKTITVYSEPFWRAEGLSGSAYSDQGPAKGVMDCSPASGAGVLVALVCGQDARRWSAAAPSERRAAVLQQLVRYFGPAAAKPEDFLEKDWSSDIWSRGGYGMHFPPGVLTQFGPACWAPVGAIHWAGTEIATEWRLYMEGALQSGEHAAAEVVAALDAASPRSSTRQAPVHEPAVA